jgi:hypothetical protein
MGEQAVEAIARHRQTASSPRIFGKSRDRMVESTGVN